jgi:hypothetical protein
MSPTTQVTSVQFCATVIAVGSTTIVRLPEPASKALPSRGQVAVAARLRGVEFDTVVEPDGRRGHWIRLTPALLKAARARVGDDVDIELTVTPEWPEPEVPRDLAAALSSAPADVQERWADITPMARWEWVRWVNATANPATRQRRVEVSISKLDHGKRRPCCFDLSSCTDPDVAKSGKLVTGR